MRIKHDKKSLFHGRFGRGFLFARRKCNICLDLRQLWARASSQLLWRVRHRGREIRPPCGGLGPRAKRDVTTPRGLYNSPENVFSVNKRMSYLLATLQSSHSHTLTRNCCWLGSLHTIDVSCDVTIWVAIFLMRLETTTDNLQKTRGIHHLNGDLLGVTSSPEVNCS